MVFFPLIEKILIVMLNLGSNNLVPGESTVKRFSPKCNSCASIDGIECKGGKEIFIKKDYWVYQTNGTLHSHLCASGNF